jgi:hypothetical protein
MSSSIPRLLKVDVLTLVVVILFLLILILYQI